MTKSSNDLYRVKANAERQARRVRAALYVAALCLSASLIGCDSLQNHQCCLFKPGGIFAQDDREIERISSREESDAITRAAAASSYEKKSAWEPTESELRYARRNNVDLKNYVWAAQRPNGGALFPQKLPAPGPIVVMEPSVISAPVGSDIILVASYVGSDSQYLRVGETLKWNLTGVGSFSSTNPSNFSSCLKCPLSPTSRKIEGRSETTETSGQLYRITRGTKSKEDDITILRGQSWMAVTSNEEGTSTVSVTGDSVPNWEHRRATAEIHWVDAAFLYPKSATGPLDRPGILETALIRRSNSEALVNWPVKYEIVTGEGGFDAGNGNIARSVTIGTGADGKARALLKPSSSQPGTTEAKVSILRPGTTEYKQATIDSRSVFYTWTSNAPIGLEIQAPEAGAVNSDLHYRIFINNYSDFFYSTGIRVTIPYGTRFVSIQPPIGHQTTAGELNWQIRQLNPKEYHVIDLVLHKEYAGNVDLNVKLFDTRCEATPTQQTASAPSSGAVTPPTTADGNQPPRL